MLKAGMPPLCLPRRLPHRLLHWAWCVMGVMSLLSSRWFYPGGGVTVTPLSNFPLSTPVGYLFFSRRQYDIFVPPRRKYFPLEFTYVIIYFPLWRNWSPPHCHDDYLNENDLYFITYKRHPKQYVSCTKELLRHFHNNFLSHISNRSFFTKCICPPKNSRLLIVLTIQWYLTRFSRPEISL